MRRPGLLAAARRGPPLAAAGALLCLLLGPPVAPEDERELRLAFLGDSGTGGWAQRKVRDQLLARVPDRVFLLGDNVYEVGSRRLFDDRYDDIYRPVMVKGARFHAALGNHDVQLCRAGLLDPLDSGANAYLWRDPGCDVEDQLAHASFGYARARRYYSVAVGRDGDPLLEVFMLDSNTLANDQSKLAPGREDRAQLEWLDDALSDSKARWKIVALHHPVYTPAAQGARWGLRGHLQGAQEAGQLTPLLRKRKVDVVFAAHNHFYARLFPQEGIRYFISGGGGAAVYPFLRTPSLVAAGGPFHHLVYARLTEKQFEYYVIDREGRSRDAGYFAKGDAVDTALPEGALPPPSVGGR